MVLPASQNRANPDPATEVPAVIRCQFCRSEGWQRTTTIDAEGDKPPGQIEPGTCNTGAVGCRSRRVSADDDDLIARLVGASRIDAGAFW